MISVELVSLAFSAGLVAFLNPCGFAMLPVYVTYYFKNEGLEKSSLPRRLFASLLFGLMVSLGFVFVYSTIGVIISYIGRGLLRYVGWFDLAVGILLIIIGIIYLFNLNSKISFHKLTNFGERLKANKLNNKYGSFFLYGVGFALASLGCVLPIFLLVVTAAIEAGGILNGILIFLIYAAGKSSFMLMFSAGVAISKTLIEKTLNQWLPYVYRFGSLVVIFAGIYLIYNQVVLGRLFV